MWPKSKPKFVPLLAMGAAFFIHGCGGGSDSNRVNPASANLNPQGAGVAEPGGKVGIHPLSGPSGSTVAVSGRGFVNACGAALYLRSFGGETLANADVGDGDFNIQAVLPEGLEPGEVTIVGELLGSDGAACTQSTGTTFEAKFEVMDEMPIIELAVHDGRPGSDVGVTGRGFCPQPECSDVTLLIDGQVATPGVEVAEDGTFSSAAMVPAIDAAGAVAVVAVQTAADGSVLRGFGEVFVTVRPNEEPPVIQ